MQKLYYIIFILCFYFSTLLFSGESLFLSSKENNISSLNYLSSKTIEDHKNSFIELNENNEYNLELPSYSSFYMIEDGTEISASFIINSSFIIPFEKLIGIE